MDCRKWTETWITHSIGNLEYKYTWWIRNSFPNTCMNMIERTYICIWMITIANKINVQRCINCTIVWIFLHKTCKATVCYSRHLKQTVVLFKVNEVKCLVTEELFHWTINRVDTFIWRRSYLILICCLQIITLSFQCLLPNNICFIISASWCLCINVSILMSAF